MQIEIRRITQPAWADPKIYKHSQQRVEGSACIQNNTLERNVPRYTFYYFFLFFGSVILIMMFY